MKRYLILLAGIILLAVNLYPQDIIRKKSGEVLYCKINAVESDMIYYSVTINDVDFMGNIQRSEVSDFTYNYAKKQKQQEDRKNVPHYVFNVSIDPMGFAFYGPVCFTEFYAQSESKRYGFGIYTGFRVNSLGYLYTIQSSHSFFSFTLPVGLKIYPKTRTRADGFFLGPHCEIGNWIGLFGADLGYKWRFADRFTVELSDWIGGVWYNAFIQDGQITSPDYFVPYMFTVKMGVSL